MSLQDIVREQTRPILDLLKGTERNLEDHRRNQRSAETREGKVKQEAAAIQPAASERQETLRGVRIKVQELQSQLAELQRRLLERKKDYELAEIQVLELQEEHNEKLRDASQARKDAEQWAQKIRETEELVGKYQERLRNERRTAFRKYLDGVWTNLLASEREADAAKEALAALEAFNRARHEDPRLAELWEARQEWQRIAESAGPPQVRQTASRELQRIEEELQKRFPGALMASTAGTPDEVEEVFLYPRHGAAGYLLPLFIPPEVCKSLESGGAGKAEDLAVRVIWTFARALRKKEGSTGKQESRFAIQGGSFVMLVEEGPAEIQDRDPMTMTLVLPGGGRVSFIVSELPQDIQGAVSDENLNS